MNNSEELAINKTENLPLFSEIKSEQIIPAVKQAISENKALIEKTLATDKHLTWDNFIKILEQADDHLSKLWSRRMMPVCRFLRNMVLLLDNIRDYMRLIWLFQKIAHLTP